jgi:hypothetical protein
MSNSLHPFFCAFVAVSCTFALAAQMRPVTSESSTHKAQIVSAVRVTTAKNSPAYLVNFRFDFSPSTNVYIKDLGLVPSKGNYQFISNQKEIQFSDSATGTLLESIPISETTVVAAEPPLNEIPRDNQFSQGITSYTWDSPASLQERANTILAQYFNYLPHENDKLVFLATTYTPLSLDKRLEDKGISAELALLLSFPYDPVAGRYSFHIQYSAKEGRALSDEFRPTENTDILQAAKVFIDRIVSEMKAGK